LTSLYFNEIEHKHECEPDLQYCDSVPNFKLIFIPVSLPNLDPIPKPTLIPVPINFVFESLILESRIQLMEKECESQFFDLNSTLEPKLTLETKFDLSHIPESMLVPAPFIPKPKSSISQNHIPLLDLGIDDNDSEMIFQDWLYKVDNFHDRILHEPIHIRECHM